MWQFDLCFNNILDIKSDPIRKIDYSFSWFVAEYPSAVDFCNSILLPQVLRSLINIYIQNSIFFF
jgi:hypothetical protein